MDQAFFNELDDLIAKYLENKCSEEEKIRLYELFGTVCLNNMYEEKLLKLLNDFQEEQHEVHTVDFKAIYSKLKHEMIDRELRANGINRLRRKNRIIRLVSGSVTIAAVFFIAFFLGTLVNRHSGTVAAIQNDSISLFNTIKAPFGAKSEIILSDGTEIMLNAGSTIKYGNDFNSDNRNLILEGEAYFKVAKNTNLPLIVNAGKLNIKATGTEFNIKAYFDEGVIETTLINGEVEITQAGVDADNDKPLVLKPNQKAIYTSKSDQLTIESEKEIETRSVKDVKIVSDNLLVSLKTDVEQVTAWTKNKLIIRSENLESLCTKLQRKYNVTFVFRDEEIKKHRFTGILLDETFTQVMDVIKLTAPVDYEMEGRTVYLFSKNTEGKTN